GVTGAPPPTIPLRIVARNADTGERDTVSAELADEADVGLPSGVSPASIVVPMAAAQAGFVALGGSPAQQSARMCLRIGLRGLDDPARFCNRYVGSFGIGGGVLGAPYLFDLYDALAAVDGFAYGTPHVESIDVRLDVEQGLDQAFLLSVRGPRVLRRGETVTLRLGLQRYRGERLTRRVRLEVPRTAPLGLRKVRLDGTPADDGYGEGLIITLDEEGNILGGSSSGPKTLAGLARSIERIERDEPVYFRLPSAHKRGPRGARRGGNRPRVLLADPKLRISGEAAYEARVVRAAAPRAAKR
ncbi:MAG TPA: hypothetical protein VIL49_18975, partial [Capillimicrobium sp.]